MNNQLNNTYGRIFDLNTLEIVIYHRKTHVCHYNKEGTALKNCDGSFYPVKKLEQRSGSQQDLTHKIELK